MVEAALEGSQRFPSLVALVPQVYNFPAFW